MKLPRRRKSCHCEQCGFNSTKVTVVDQLYPTPPFRQKVFEMHKRELMKLSLISRSLKDSKYYNEVQETVKVVRKNPKKKRAFLSNMSHNTSYEQNSDKSNHSDQSCIEYYNLSTSHQAKGKKPAGEKKCAGGTLPKSNFAASSKHQNTGISRLQTMQSYGITKSHAEFEHPVGIKSIFSKQKQPSLLLKNQGPAKPH